MSIWGIDISNWQSNINLDVVQADFVICKATEGTYFVDKYCDSFYQKAKAKGKLLGVYHFASGTASGKQEADYFLRNIQGYVGEAMLILDWEARAVYQGVAYAKEFIDRVHEVTGVYPVIYMSQSVCSAYDWSSVAKNCGLWVANYGDNPIIQGYAERNLTGSLGAWKYAIMFQYSSQTRLNGYSGNLDANICYLTKEQWKAYANGGKADKKTTTVKTEAKTTPVSKPTTSAKETAVYYTVQKGDTLSAIASKYGTTYQELASMNGIANPNVIYVGQKLKVKGTVQTTTSKTSSAVYYTVQKGDTLSGIASRYNTTYQAIANMNGIKNPNIIYPGQKLKVK